MTMTASATYKGDKGAALYTDKTDLRSRTHFTGAKGDELAEYSQNFKLDGAVRDTTLYENLGDVLDFTTTYNAQKGETFTRTLVVTGLRQGNLTANVEKQGENFYPTSKLWNFRVEKKFGITEHQSVDAMFDLFNIPNRNTVVGWNTQSGPNFLHQGTAIINPRIFRLAARYNF